jgi:hypothetical protein
VVFRRLCVRLGAMTTRIRIAALVALLAVGAAGCGSSSKGSGGDEVAPTPSPADFPQPQGRSMMQMYNALGAGGGPALAPTGSDLIPGKQRYGFALFTTARKQISGVPVAVYAQKQGTAKVLGPFPARDLKLTVAPPYQSETVAKDPDAAKTLYVSQIDFPKPGTYAIMGVAKLDGRLVATSPAPAKVTAHDPVPGVGDKAPVIDTPTKESVGGDLSQIDTRQPPDDMHDVNFKDAVGKKPIMLVFATPALCQSRVCGPVVDIAQEVKSESGSQADWVHMEVYRDNTIKSGCLEGTRPQQQCLRPQFLAYHMSSEPWLFAIDKNGKIAARIEGAYSKGELEDALKAATTG